MYRDRGVEVVGISTMDSARRVKDFSRKYGLTYLQLLDGEQAFERYVDVGVVPRTIVLDSAQRIAWLELGYTEEKLQTLIGVVRSLLEEEGGAESSGR